MTLECAQLFYPTEGKGPHEGPFNCHKHCFSLEVMAVLIIIHPCNALPGVIIDTKKDEDKSNLFLF